MVDTQRRLSRRKGASGFTWDQNLALRRSESAVGANSGRLTLSMGRALNARATNDCYTDTAGRRFA
jgi:hypothetical protein